MHLQQTKVDSRATGGPQYYLHDVTQHVKEFLRRRGACPVVLQTPYGIAASPFMAVDRDHKLDASGAVVDGKVGHDRIQQAGGEESIGEAIRRWYGLKARVDFERIDVEVSIHPDGHFSYQVTRYLKLPRAVVLCMTHDYVNPPDHVDVLELPALADYLGD